MEIELDERKRAPLAKLLKGRGPKKYLAECLDDGTIVLTPAETVPLDRTFLDRAVNLPGR